jgi:alpha-1,3-rhamnosyltransferase
MDSKITPLVSVIVPSYNHQHYIEQCINSIISQTYSNIQLIVIDDGSKDNSFEIIERLSRQYGFFAEKQVNIGLSMTLNKAINNYAKGEYIAVVASDDYWDSEKIEKQVKFLMLHSEYAMCCGKAYIVNDNGDKVGILASKKQEKISFDQLIMGNSIAALTVMMKRKVFIEVGGFDQKLRVEDWDMWLRISNKYEIGYMDEFLAFYRMHHNNSTLGDITGVLAFEDDLLKILSKWHNSPLYPLALRRFKLGKAVILAKSGAKKKAYNELIKTRDYLFSTDYWYIVCKVIIYSIITK